MTRNYFWAQSIKDTSVLSSYHLYLEWNEAEMHFIRGLRQICASGLTSTLVDLYSFYSSSCSLRRKNSVAYVWADLLHCQHFDSFQGLESTIMVLLLDLWPRLLSALWGVFWEIPLLVLGMKAHICDSVTRVAKSRGSRVQDQYVLPGETCLRKVNRWIKKQPPIKHKSNMRRTTTIISSIVDFVRPLL